MQLPLPQSITCLPKAISALCTMRNEILQPSLNAFCTQVTWTLDFRQNCWFVPDFCRSKPYINGCDAISRNSSILISWEISIDLSGFRLSYNLFVPWALCPHDRTMAAHTHFSFWTQYLKVAIFTQVKNPNKQTRFSDSLSFFSVRDKFVESKSLSTFAPILSWLNHKLFECNSTLPC